ncbi:transmembrane epididymal protein 1A-like [Sorex fumeus]|uniref:transmembrane epididymal protein 1A-like n=1 Tax=Sorex fumeus TaxID=62283 RepID=UPI0024ADABE1|nr:transmembrane epididymal protein 1A-like [Sorex fumeus]
MGTLTGHLVPGIVLYGVGLYYAVLASRAILRGQKLLSPPLPPKEKQGQRWWQRVQVEGLVKVGAGMTLVLGEFFFPPGANHFPLVDWEDPRRPFRNHDSWQHATIFGVFLLSALADFASQVWLARPSVPLERAATALAVAVLLLEMGAHVEHKDALEVRVHALLLLPAVLMLLVLAAEVWAPDQPPLWMLKAWLTLVFGSWLLHVTSILYAPLSGQRWSAENPVDLAFAVTFFCWHLGFGAAALAAVYSLCSLCHRRHSSSGLGGAWGSYQTCPMDDSGGELEKLRPRGLSSGQGCPPAPSCALSCSFPELSEEAE